MRVLSVDLSAGLPLRHRDIGEALSLSALDAGLETSASIESGSRTGALSVSSC
jgi:hypothetical protein